MYNRQGRIFLSYLANAESNLQYPHTHGYVTRTHPLYTYIQLDVDIASIHYVHEMFGVCSVNRYSNNT